MRKLLCLILSLGMIFSLTACFYSDAPVKESATDVEVAEKNEETYGLNETAVFTDLKFTAIEFKESDGDDFFTPESGNIFVGVKFQIENISDEEQTISSLLLFEGYADDVQSDYSLSAACAFEGDTLDASIAPGKKLVGWYALEVPQDWSTVELHVQADWLSNSSAKFVFTK